MNLLEKKIFWINKGRKKKKWSVCELCVIYKVCRDREKNSVIEVDNEERLLCYSYDYFCFVIFSYYYFFIV